MSMTLTDDEVRMVREALDEASDDIFMEFGTKRPSYIQCCAALTMLDAKAGEGEGVKL